ncbi:MAG: DHH family phosphoesterase [Asgard group archaeon]|nr:DHH family phosphoesterase [Asgard group archaeon]
MNETLIMCHHDCDGLTAGAIALAANPGANIWLTRPISLDDDLKRIKKKYDKIIITDIALNERDYTKTFKEMERLKDLGTEIIYIDHHPLPEGVTERNIPVTTIQHKLKGCAAELTYLLFEDRLTWKHKFLAAIGAVGDYEMETIFAQEVMNDYDHRSITFQAAIIVQALGEIPVGDDTILKKSLIERMALGILPSELNDLVERALRGSLVEHAVRDYVHKNAQAKNNLGYILDIPTGGGFVGKGALFAASAVNKPIGVCGNTTSEKISVSIRRRDSKVDLNIIARRAAKEVNGSGGGHPTAAGASIRQNKWNKFLDLLDFEIQKQL